MSTLKNGRIILKLNNFVLQQQNYSSVYFNFILNLYIAYELNWLRNPGNDFKINNNMKHKSKFIYNG